MLTTFPSEIATSSASGGAVEWRTEPGLLPYPDAVAGMERSVAAIAAGAPERIWLVQHPPLYTAGTSARDADLLDPHGLPVFRTGRGGQYTWHGPGQRIAYVMLDLRRRGHDVRSFVCALENWLIATVAAFGIAGGRREGRIGVWVHTPAGDAKIAAIGVRVRRWVTFHGIALNIDPDLSHYAGIVPCGIRGHGVTSLAALGVDASMAEVDTTLRAAFEPAFAASCRP
ncbi:MAG: lipoyl(octanoyl) transferase LipB [Bauldia sp.]|nr:lipoyl(octanoyl) transferase LipB [Bauldia sp.]